MFSESHHPSSSPFNISFITLPVRNRLEFLGGKCQDNSSSLFWKLDPHCWFLMFLTVSSCWCFWLYHFFPLWMSLYNQGECFIIIQDNWHPFLWHTVSSITASCYLYVACSCLELNFSWQRKEHEFRIMEYILCYTTTYPSFEWVSLRPANYIESGVLSIQKST